MKRFVLFRSISRHQAARVMKAPMHLKLVKYKVKLILFSKNMGNQLKIQAFLVRLLT